MKPILLLSILVFLFCFVTSLFSQTGWIQNYDPFYSYYYNNGYQTGNIQVTEDGCYVVNGTCTQSDEWEWYSKYGFLIKFDPEGNIVWTKQDSLNPYQDIWDCESETFAILPDGSFVSAGSEGLINPDYLLFRNGEGELENIVYYNDMNYKSMCVVDNGTALLFAGANSGAILQKTDLEGNELWRQNYANTTASLPVSVISTNDGGYAFFTYQFDNPDDYCLVKTDSSGSLEWSNTYDYNSQDESPNSLIQTSDEGFLLSGYTSNPDGGGFIVKTDSTGDTLWTRKFDIAEFYYIYNAVEFNSNYVLFGSSSNGGIEVLSMIDNEGNTIWYEEFPFSGLTNGEKPMQISNNGFICYLHTFDEIYLIYADEYGIVSAYEQEIPVTNSLYCYPNPFNPSTTINFNLSQDSMIDLSVYNLRGQKVLTLLDDHLVKGLHSVMWDGVDSSGNLVPSGIYFTKLKASNIESCCKMVLLK